MIKHLHLKSPTGFTIIEMLVTITIIGILSVIGLITYTTAQKNARNARRQADVKVVDNALELYYADNRAYPPGSGDLLFACSSTSPGANALQVLITQQYLKELPHDPKCPGVGNGDYFYRASEGRAYFNPE